ncbi:MAG: restriction endonuclease subunit S [Undibacterium sp.]|nr:restriction endonuclease subunit S [Opitutaceae bacterium]
MKSASASKVAGASSSRPGNREQDAPATLDPRPALAAKLRFPEFRDGPGWEERRVQDICELNPSHPGLPEKFFYIDLEAVQRGHLKARTFVNKSEAPSRAQRLLEVGDVIFQIVRPYQRNNLFFSLRDSHPFVASTGYAQLRARESEAFLYHAIHTDEFVSRVMAQCTGSSYPAINSSDLAEIPLATPSLAEQQKIAECLGSLDELIGAESQKLDALKTHKKGLMQQLLPREGEALPRLRFPEFQSSQEWETKVGGNLFTNRKEDGEEGLPIYSVTMNDGMVPRASFDRDFSDIEDPAGNKKACRGDIAYNMMRMWQGALGVAPGDCMVSPAYIVLKPRRGVCAEFFAYLFKLPQSLRLLTATSRGLTKDRLRLYFDDFAKMRLRVPEYGEQHRIATCLTSLDDLIAAQINRLSALQIHKQGLMQQLFPSPADADA